MAEQEKAKRFRLVIASLLIAFYMLFLIVNVEYEAGLTLFSISLFSFLVIVLWDKIPKKRPDRKLISFEKDWASDLVFGILSGLGLVLILTFFPFASIAVPQLPQSSAFPSALATAGQYATVVIGAPLAEEIAFRVVLFALLWVVLGMSYFWATIISSAVFSLFHINAYAGVFALNPILSVSGAFFSAFIIAVSFAYINRYRGSVSASIGAHGAVNGGIVAKSLVIVGV